MSPPPALTGPEGVALNTSETGLNVTGNAKQTFAVGTYLQAPLCRSGYNRTCGNSCKLGCLVFPDNTFIGAS